MTLYAHRLEGLVGQGEKADLSQRLMIASMMNAQKRLEAAGERFARGDFS